MGGKRIGCRVLAVVVAIAATGCDTTVDDKASNNPSTPTTSVAAPRPPEESLSPLHEQPLPNVQGKTFTAAIVDFPPSGRAVPHRHGAAFVYAYVLHGSVRSTQEGGTTNVYRQGDSWTEQPGVHHLLTENISRADSAKLLVVFVSDTGESLKIPDRPN